MCCVLFDISLIKSGVEKIRALKLNRPRLVRLFEQIVSLFIFYQDTHLIPIERGETGWKREGQRIGNGRSLRLLKEHSTSIWMKRISIGKHKTHSQWVFLIRVSIYKLIFISRSSPQRKIFFFFFSVLYDDYFVVSKKGAIEMR